MLVVKASMMRDVPEDAVEDAVRVITEWVPLANENAQKKMTMYEKRRHSIEMKRKAREEEQKKRLDALNAKLKILNKKLGQP
jgi:hypothetical protein